MTDPIADMLTRIRNGVHAKHDGVTMPASKLKVAIAGVLKEEGFIRDYRVDAEGSRNLLKVDLSYTGRKDPVLTGIKRVSKPGLRVYVQKREIPRVFGGKRVALIGASPGGFGTILSQNAWLPVLKTLGTEVWSGKKLLVSRARTVFDEAGNLTDAKVAEQLTAFLQGFVAFVARR